MCVVGDGSSCKAGTKASGPVGRGGSGGVGPALKLCLHSQHIPSTSVVSSSEVMWGRRMKFVKGMSP